MVPHASIFELDILRFAVGADDDLGGAMGQVVAIGNGSDDCSSLPYQLIS
jgi:hypothetical protein